eukprot:gnl/Trimastix_PCT/1327.p1 GENE.gnl/Trimastix_PCT/1327~~gnl/Trimastix_PCT/1327.p1  ORF type:complete len:517 (+),score=131.39 gnl/Trimastix_PCT/1327:138-1688(+)
MCYGYWKNRCHERHAVFDLFFRRNPFRGEFTVFAGLEEVLRLVKNFHFTESDIDYLKTVLPHAEPAFFEWLSQVDCSQVTVYAMKEGTIAFPRVPLLTIEGPLAISQLLETPLLNLVNFASLMATNAARMRLAAGPTKRLMEFGLRRAQGPDGGMSASRYSFVGGFELTSNVQAGKMFGIGIAGTHAHSFVMSFEGPDDLPNHMLAPKQGGEPVDFFQLAMEKRNAIDETTNVGELTAFVAYALAFPDSFLALVDTYETLKSGVPNFLAVSEALLELGYTPVGIRLDSGDLAYLSKQARKMFTQFSERVGRPELSRMTIVASNDINESTLYSLKDQGHEIDTFGIGTHLVTCQKQPALGCVFKLVEVDGHPRIKMSEDIIKTTIPCHKAAYRIMGQNDMPLFDVLTLKPGTDEAGKPPKQGKRFLCRHPFEENKRVYVIPTQVVPLLHTVWKDNEIECDLPSITDIRAYVRTQLSQFRRDHLRNMNPTPYKVSVSPSLYDYMHALWLSEAPIPIIS